MSKEQDLVDAIIEFHTPMLEKLHRLIFRDLLIFGVEGEVKVETENNEVVYYYKGPYSDEFRKVE